MAIPDEFMSLFVVVAFVAVLAENREENTKARCLRDFHWCIPDGREKKLNLDYIMRS
jgi:hypothetical protein